MASSGPFSCRSRRPRVQAGILGTTRGCGNPRCDTSRLRGGRRPDKAAQPTPSEITMAAIAVILVFIAVILGLNRFEFGRFD